MSSEDIMSSEQPSIEDQLIKASARIVLTVIVVVVGGAWAMWPKKSATVAKLITRERRGLSLFPIYRMYVQCDDGDALVVVARRRKRADGHSFHLSTDADDLTSRGPSYVGKLRSNLVGSEWMLYDGGLNPSKLPRGSVAAAARRELGMVVCQQNVVGAAAPRRVRATLPALDDATGAPRDVRPSSVDETLPARAKANRLLVKDHIFLASKEPKLNPATGAHSLDFKGRVTQGSVKNFQLARTEAPDAVACQFGKVGKHEFVLDYAWPLTPLQAFGFALTSLAYKLANEGG